jgi:hypothetical protein
MLKSFLAWFKQTYAPYAVHIVPLDRRHDSQVVCAWSRSEAIEWVACSLRDDNVYIVRRACKIQPRKLVAARSAVVEVTYE